MFTVGSCTVLYNPNESVLTNLNSYSNCVDVSVVVDNSDTKNEISQSLKNDPNFIYIDMDGNKGIAAALDKGIEYLNSKNIDFALTMDQDSLFPTKYYPNILKLVNKYKKQLELYQEALEQSFNKKVSKKYIYSTCLGQAIEI